MLPGTANLRRAGAVPELHLDSGAETVRAQGVLTLQMQTYGSQVVIRVDGQPRASAHQLGRNGKVSLAMRQIGQAYVTAFNRRHRRSGTL